VSIEEQFYLAWPLIMKFAGRYVRQICVGLIGISLATRWWLVHNGAMHPGIWCNTLARLDPIAGGALLAAILNGRCPTLGVL
jgi:peptidoglycan/LPS O-acetylase OafA/YrhL